MKIVILFSYFWLVFFFLRIIHTRIGNIQLLTVSEFLNISNIFKYLLPIGTYYVEQLFRTDFHSSLTLYNFNSFHVIVPFYLYIFHHSIGRKSSFQRRLAFLIH